MTSCECLPETQADEGGAAEGRARKGERGRGERLPGNGEGQARAADSADRGLGREPEHSGWAAEEGEGLQLEVGGEAGPPVDDGGGGGPAGTRLPQDGSSASAVSVDDDVIHAQILQDRRGDWRPYGDDVGAGEGFPERRERLSNRLLLSPPGEGEQEGCDGG